MPKEFFKESELAALAKKFRKKTGKNKSEAAKDFGVHRATIAHAEESPGQSLTNLRIHMIEKYSGCKIVGPLYQLRKV